ncbi:MAG: hypothetical protein M1831_000230 [Alyxoria varia]|nr:MAG: hypothetical protein M1831_000230 [Alyxoria varia]
MAEFKGLSPAKCIVIASSLACEPNLPAFRTLKATRPEIFDLELTLRILLTFLPETLDPQGYFDLIVELTCCNVPLIPQEAAPIETTLISRLSEDEAQRKLQYLHIQHLRNAPNELAADTIENLVIRFLISRASRIMRETGLIILVIRSVTPFLTRSQDLRSWFTSAVLPLLRTQLDKVSQTSPPTSRMKARNSSDLGITAVRDVDALEGLENICGTLEYLAQQKGGQLPPYVEPLVSDLTRNYIESSGPGSSSRISFKKAMAVLSALRKSYPRSQTFRQMSALLSASHSLSYYKMANEDGSQLGVNGVLDKEDPLAPVEKALRQNFGSYTNLDDMIEIGEQLIIATTLSEFSNQSTEIVETETQRRLRHVPQRATSMCIESALSQDDFETAYSYVVNRLGTPSVSELTKSEEVEDDISWRAAFNAGRYRTLPKASESARNTTALLSRHLEQRMELLAHALSLAPASALPDVLAAWRRCEEELLTVLSREAEEEQAADDSAERLPYGPTGSRTMPGSLEPSLDTETGYSVQPRRKDIGRGATEEAPMGLFDVARGVAASLSRHASGNTKAMPDKSGPAAHAVKPGPGQATQGEFDEWGEWGDEEDSEDNKGERVRKRDMVTNALTGSLVSGVGWVLGANPIDHDR